MWGEAFVDFDILPSIGVTAEIALRDFDLFFEGYTKFIPLKR